MQSDLSVINSVFDQMDVAIDSLSARDRVRLERMILRINNALDGTQRAVDWSKINNFYSTTKIPVICTVNSQHLPYNYPVESIYSPSKGIAACSECKFGITISDFIGKKFGFLTLNGVVPITGGFRANLTCSCGITIEEKLSTILGNQLKTCRNNACVQKQQGKIDWFSQKGKQFGALKLVDIIGSSKSSNAEALMRCAVNSCHQPERNTTHRNTQSLINGEYNNCLCGAWINPSREVARIEVDEGKWCNNISYAYRYLLESNNINKPYTSLEVFAKRIKNHVRALSINKQDPTEIRFKLLSGFIESNILKGEFIFYAYLITRDDLPIYAGITINLERRTREHFEGRGKDLLIQSIKKYGKTCHKLRAVFSTNSFNQVADKEKELIDKYDLINKGLNERYGGAFNPLIKKDDDNLIPTVYCYYQSLTPEQYPPKKQVAIELGMDKDVLVRIFALLVRISNIENYRKVRRASNAISQRELKEIKKAIIDGVPATTIAQQFNIRYREVNAIRKEHYDKRGRLSPSGRAYALNLEDRQLVALCLEYGYPVRQIINVVAPFIANIPSKNSLFKHYNLYAESFKKISAECLLETIKIKLGDFSDKAQPIRSPFIKGAAEVGYAQQDLLELIIVHYTSGGSHLSFQYQGSTIAQDTWYDSIKFVNLGKRLPLRKHIEERIDYKSLRRRIVEFKKTESTFGRFIEHHVLIAIAEGLTCGVSYTQLAEQIRDRFDETVNRKYISKYKNKIMEYAKGSSGNRL